MMASTALSEHALGLLRKKGMTQLADIDCFVDGWEYTVAIARNGGTSE